jgi:hypothetical protein
MLKVCRCGENLGGVGITGLLESLLGAKGGVTGVTSELLTSDI